MMKVRVATGQKVRCHMPFKQSHTWISSQSEQKYNCSETCISDINIHIQNALQKHLMIEACDNKYFKIKLEQGTEGSIVPSLPGIVIYLPRCHFLVMTRQPHIYQKEIWF